MADRIEDAKQMFGDIYGQVTWLAERLSEARILVLTTTSAQDAPE